jgi:hypothetical protein
LSGATDLDAKEGWLTFAAISCRLDMDHSRSKPMLAVRHHNSLDYARLPDIDSTGASIITSEDQSCLEGIGNYLLQARAHARFGVTLLHSHFPVDDDETLLEEIHYDERAITLRAVSGQPFNAHATNVCFDACNGRGELRLVGLEFASHETLAGVAPIDSSDRDVLMSVMHILRSRNKLNRFGVRLLHDPLNLGEVPLLETCDPVRRILTSRSEADDTASVQSVPTVFRWEEVTVSEGVVIAQGCMQFCRTVSRCVQPGRGGHNPSRSHEPTGHESV